MAGRVPLAGSFQTEPEAASVVEDPDKTGEASVTVYLKSRTEQESGSSGHASIAELQSRATTRQVLMAQHSDEYAEAADALQRFAQSHGLRFRVDVTRRCVHLEGNQDELAQSLGATLRSYYDGRQRYQARLGPLLLPAEIEAHTQAVLGFDQRPVIQHRLTAESDDSGAAGLWPTQIAELYGIPGTMDAPGQCVGIIALGGGYLPSDLATAAESMDRPFPLVVDFPVGGVINNFGGGDTTDEEIALDLQVMASIVPSARIIVYFAANNLQGMAQAINQAVTDDVNRPQVVSISWGSAEKFWTQSARDTMQSVLEDAARLKVTVVAAAGDALATAGLRDGSAHVLFPASSPLVLACGGTSMTLSPDGAKQDEIVWNEDLIGTGGGISDIFEVPDYQKNFKLPKSFNDGGVRRGVPDVAALAAKSPGYKIMLNGQTKMKDGTSAATPLWAALIAIANAQRAVPIGLPHPVLYGIPSPCSAITAGNNRINGIGYDAGPGWNACTGLGAPDGARTITALVTAP
ncbi:MAG TPA: S53 family peptidase [Candidatus Angelobacter sp.]|jgi:kumamolisin